jgi:3-oxoacyl-[acyl-carrier protein] reductase
MGPSTWDELRGSDPKFPQETGISRYGKPEEIADLMAFLVSPAAKWLTGASIRMDGGEVKGI